MKHATRFNCSPCLVALLIAHTSCVALESTPPYTPQEGPPCEALPGTSEPVYLCDEVTQGIVFMSEGGDDAAPGTREEPVKSIEQALVLVTQREQDTVILIAGSPILPAVTIESPVDLIGGYTSTFEPDGLARPRFESAQAPVLRVQGVDQEIRFANLDMILLPNEMRQGPAWTTYVGNSTLVIFQDVKFTAPDGAHGVSMNQATDGAGGMMGEVAGSGTRVRPGEGGVNTSCPEANGGVGGRGGDMSTPEVQGMTSAAGIMGGGIGQQGASGRPVDNGEDGMMAMTWAILDGEFLPHTPATPGQRGSHGEGGGGGGGGMPNGTQGGGGGGGGAGGCGGTSGQPGTSGYPSLALVVESSTALLQGATQLTTGLGGDGGLGGNGGLGGEGSQGGQGSLGSTGGQTGGVGGQGSAGGDGGRGGHGLPGESIGIFCIDAKIQRAETVIITVSSSGVDAQGMSQPGEMQHDCQALP